jgi:hypothetical protein
MGMILAIILIAKGINGFSLIPGNGKHMESLSKKFQVKVIFEFGKFSKRKKT